MEKSFIEETFPIKEVGEESAREKSIRHGHISTLHIWWARRPLASSRATNYAALIPMPTTQKEIDKKKQFIVKLSRWENSLDQNLLDVARKDIFDGNRGTPPKILDPFSGGGAIPLEALRLGCETYANDYNPVASLILKCTVEYPQKFGSTGTKGLSQENVKNTLYQDVKKWGMWVLDHARQDLKTFYPEETDGSIPVGYIWARTIPCQNPACGIEVPLMRQYLLAKNSNRQIALYPSTRGKTINFKIVGQGYDKSPQGFDPSKGTISQAIVTCPICGTTMDDKTTRKLFMKGKAGHKLLAIVAYNEGVKGNNFRVATEADLKAFRNAQRQLEKKRDTLVAQWGIDPVPDEIIPTPTGEEYEPGIPLFRFYSIVLYGMTKWRDLFSPRQKLALVTFSEHVRDAYNEMIRNGYSGDYAKAVTTYLAFAVDRLVDYSSTLCVWAVSGEFVGHTFGRQSLPMVWDYFELMPWSQASGDWNSALGWILRVIENTSNIPSRPASVSTSSATHLSFPDNHFDAVFTDPPYYDNVPYSYISDFFYVWLKRTVGHLYPDLFATPLTPKMDEIFAELPVLRGMDKDIASEKIPGIKTSKQFESMLSNAFKEINRVLKPGGIAIIVYAHKSTAGWETLINSLIDSGLVVTAAWPIHTERTGRLVAAETAALASSIYIVSRKMTRQSIGFYRNVKGELREFLLSKLDRLWKEGISGADFFVSAIGSSIEVFGKYEKIIDDEGNTIRADKLLEEVRRIVIDYAVKQVLHNGFAAEISQLTRLYVLWRWAYGDASIIFDDARKLAQSAGIDLANEWNKGFIAKNKEFIHILGPQDRKLEDIKDSKELIDVLHRVLLLWNKSKNDEVVKVLKETGLGKSDVFYRVAQAISESLPNESKEKKLLEGFLAGRERISKEARKETGQRRLFE